MRIHYVLHADFEKPGSVEDWARKQKAITTTSKPFAGEKLANPSAFDLLVLMGGPQTPLRMELFPYLKDEVELIHQSTEQGKIVLGFCLGAQLIGEAFGGKTERSPHKEVGVFPIKLTAEGKKDPLFSQFPEEFPVMHWHNDMPGLPHGSQILAESEGCPRQAIRFQNKVYGFQCHPEPKLENIKEMITHCRQDLKPGRYVQTEEVLLRNNYAEMNTILHGFLDRLKNVA